MEKKKVKGVGRPSEYSDNNPRATITLAITTEHKEKLKLHAMQNHTTASKLLMQWIEENCE